RGDPLLGNAVQQCVEAASHQRERHAFLTPLAQPDHNVMALLPQRQELRDEFRRILEVAVELDRGIPRGIAVAGEERSLEPVIAVEAQNFPPGVAGTELAENPKGAVLAVIVGEDELDIVSADTVEYAAQRLIGAQNIELLVVDRHDDGNEPPSAAWRR